MESRLTDLEIRFTHQEATLEELTHTVLTQQRAIDDLTRQLSQVHALLRDFSPSPIASASEETPPPHY